MLHQLKIHLENDTLILRGSPDESVGCVLRGYIVFHVKETMKVKGIHLNLNGKMKIQWNERNHQQKKEFAILNKDWKFLSSDKKLHTFTPNTYKYPFEYIFPGNLAESIESNSYGSVSYKLKATVDRPAFSPNLVDRQSLRLVRQFIPSYHLSNVPLQIANTWTNRLDYRITLPKRIYCRGEQISMDISLCPKPEAMLRLRYVSIFLKEYTTFGNTDHGHRTESKIIRFFRDESFASDGLHWHKSEVMAVPHSFGSIQCDTHNPFFKIEHKLKFTFSFINSDGLISELRASLPVDIVSQKLEDMDQELPTYENAWRSAPYSPYSPSEDSLYPLTPQTPGHHPSDDYFGYRPLAHSSLDGHLACGVLPSYGSMFPEQSSDGLPSYS
ncbi:hypothetical protein BD560DRAFT_453329 [Blakeslea trispora]|nr:hypothetical protein BD560DRAFT_453329 [Blakeslea trispora]